MGNGRKKKTLPEQQLQPAAQPAAAAAAAQPSSPADASLNDTGCLICGKDDDHAHILLCEVCNGEYHTYCLEPQLEGVPQNAWYCDKCQPNDAELLDKQVAALHPAFTSRFGEILWAQGGVGYGWWPSAVCDPRALPNGAARAQARRHLGKRHLLYFFQCRDLPFSVLPDTKLMTWIEGLAENFHLGRAAKSFGKARYVLFQRAMQAAILEMEKPQSKRLDLGDNNNNSSSSNNSPLHQDPHHHHHHANHHHHRQDHSTPLVPSPARGSTRQSHEDDRTNKTAAAAAKHAVSSVGRRRKLKRTFAKRTDPLDSRNGGAGVHTGAAVMATKETTSTATFSCFPVRTAVVRDMSREEISAWEGKMAGIVPREDITASAAPRSAKRPKTNHVQEQQPQPRRTRSASGVWKPRIRVSM